VKRETSKPQLNDWTLIQLESKRSLGKSVAKNPSRQARAVKTVRGTSLSFGTSFSFAYPPNIRNRLSLRRSSEMLPACGRGTAGCFPASEGRVRRLPRPLMGGFFWTPIIDSVFSQFLFGSVSSCSELDGDGPTAMPSVDVLHGAKLNHTKYIRGVFLGIRSRRRSSAIMIGLAKRDGKNAIINNTAHNESASASGH